MPEYRVPICLIGGPMDGYDEIEVYHGQVEVIPGPHHRKECGCRGIPVYRRRDSFQYVFHGYASDVVGAS